jgi:rhodanese-related sulfurtransferase
MSKEIKQLPSKELKEFLSNNKNVELLDVRTQDEWNNIGRPDGEKLGLTTHFITIIKSQDPSANKEFIEEVKKKNYS